MNRLFAALLTLQALGCATHSTLKNPGEAVPEEARPDDARHGEIAFPRPDRESCTARSRAPYRLAVRVRDDSGAAFPGVSVHLFPMGAGSEILATVRTNGSGVANVVANPPGVYAVAVAVGGFEPQIRGLTLRVGCSGQATFTLKVGPVSGKK